jgi:methyl-accepting chemotaxis protein
MHNEMIQHSTRVVHLRESIRQMHKITDQLTDMLDQMEKSAKALAKESEEKT